MRADLREARDAVLWAEAHIPVLQEHFVSWQRSDPYELVMEPDPDEPEWEFVVARQRKALDPIVIGDVGAIINSIRSGLDILMFSVLARHREQPNGNTRFPITSRSTDFHARIAALEAQQRITADEAAAIRKAKAYYGGDSMLYAIHQLDTLRKHRRLLSVEPSIKAAQATVLNGASYSFHRVMDSKTVLYRFPARKFRPTHGNMLIASEIFFDEPSLVIMKQPAVDVVRAFIHHVQALIEHFP